MRVPRGLFALVVAALLAMLLACGTVEPGLKGYAEPVIVVPTPEPLRGFFAPVGQ